MAGHSQGSLVGLVASREKKIDKFISISGAGRSIDVAGGTVKIKINGDNIIVTNPSVSGFGSIALDIIQRNGHQIKARNPTVMFTYKFVSREFVIHTGIAPMKFDIDVGHRGGQMRIFGVCNK